MAVGAVPKERRRRTPQEAEREILDSAEAFLSAHPFRDLTIDEVMDGTGLSRPSFYVYFRDRHDLAMALLARLVAQVFVPANEWLLGDAKGPTELESALRGAVEVWAEHGRVLRAFDDAATEDAEVERAYVGVIEGFVEAAALRIQKEVAEGRSTVRDPAGLARNLVWMNERILSVSFGRGQRHDPTAVADGLLEIWMQMVYGRDAG